MSASCNKQVRGKREGHVGIGTFARPPHNFFDEALEEWHRQ